MGKMVDMWKKNRNPSWILFNWYLAKKSSQVKVVPGGDFRVAYEEAMKYGGEVILGDRPLDAKDEADFVNLAILEMTKKYPTWAEIGIHERDQYMSAKLLEVAREHNTVVAVVGRYHVPRDPEELETTH